MNLILTITCLLACVALVYLFYKYNHLQNEVTGLQFQLNNLMMVEPMPVEPIEVEDPESIPESYDEEITDLETQVTDVNELINQYKLI